MKLYILTSLFWFVSLMPGIFSLRATEPVRTWTSNDGRTLQARMVETEDQAVKVMTLYGQTFVIPLEKLSDVDVAYVTAKGGGGGTPGEWLENFDQAKQRAGAAKKPILMVFTGSDWCPPCMNLEKTVLETDTFKTFAGKELVLMKVDFPRRKAQEESLKAANQQLQAAYGIRGYPTLVLVDSGGKVLSKFGYSGQGAEGFVAMMQDKLP